MADQAWNSSIDRKGAPNPRARLAKATLAAALLILAPAAVCAQVEARFLSGTYVMSAEACEKLNKLAEGVTRSAGTVPWSMDETGFHSWEGGCDFTQVTERRKGREWVVQATCIEGPDEDKETYTFVKNSNGSFAVTLRGERKSRTYTRCDVKKGK